MTIDDPQTEVQSLAASAAAPDGPKVGIIMGSQSDMAVMEKAGAVLAEKGIGFEIEVMSAHRDPVRVADVRLMTLC